MTVPPLVVGPVAGGVRVQVPWVAVAEPKTALAGSGAVTVTPVAACPPVLVAVIVPVRLVPLTAARR